MFWVYSWSEPKSRFVNGQDESGQWLGLDGEVTLLLRVRNPLGINKLCDSMTCWHNGFANKAFSLDRFSP
jgi:hypothetical protein